MSKRAPLPPGIGLRFTEHMSGTVAAPGQPSAPFEVLLTVSFDDLATALAAPDHPGRITGTVTAPSLSARPLTVASGVFNLLAEDPGRVRTRVMRYRFPMETREGRQYYVEGAKTVRDDLGPDIWRDTTTLPITVHDGGSAAAPVAGAGVVRLSVEDFARELTTFEVSGTDDEQVKLEAKARFGLFFAGRLYDTYGPLSARSGVFAPNGSARPKRPLAVSSPEVHFVQTLDGVSIRLTRYRGGRKGPVMLVHGLGVSSLIFAIDTIPLNLLEYLFAAQYDVWLLDYRTSIDLPYAHRPHTADDVATRDYPAAVAKVLDVTGAPSTQVLVHCFGANTFFMAMLAGLRGVRSAAVSQIAMHLRAPALTSVKAIFHAPELLEALGITEMSADAVDDRSFLGRVGDLLLKLYPVHGGTRDASAVSRRIAFMYGELYELDRLNQATYDCLHEMFGVASIASLNQLAAMIRAGRLVAADGTDTYLREAAGYPRLDRLAIPITIVQGEQNRCWTLESTALSFDLLREHNGPALYRRRVIPGYGHIDCIFGADAARDVYPHFLGHLEETAIV